MNTFGRFCTNVTLLIVLAIILCPSQCSAAEIILDTISVHQYRYDIHGNQASNHNWGLGYLSESGTAVGAYYNSRKHPSAYVAQVMPVSKHFGVIGGVVSGYYTKVLPLGAAYARTNLTNSISVQLTVVPPVAKMTQGVAHVSFLFKL